MLTGALLRVKFSRDLLIPRYIDAHSSEHLLLAEQLLELFHECEGKTRGELETELAGAFGDDPGAFLVALAAGFGRAKAFGCGLMLIRRMP